MNQGGGHIDPAVNFGRPMRNLLKRDDSWRSGPAWPSNVWNIDCPGKASPEEQEAGSDSEEEEETTEATQLPKPDPVTGVYDEESVAGPCSEAHALHSVETVTAIKSEIVELLEEQQQKPAPENTAKDPMSPFKTKEKAEVPMDQGLPLHTLRELMAEAGFKKFDPPEKDSDDLCLERVRRVCPHIRNFVKRVRVEEKILSRAQVLGQSSVKGKHRLLEHLLARLRRKYSLQGSRQSRFAAWAFFSKAVSEKACQAAADLQAAAELKKLVPSCAMDEEGNRAYQIVACRFHVVGKVEFALVEEILRGSLDKKGRRTGKKLSEVGLESHMVGAVRGVLLEPAEQDANGDRTYKCTCRSPAAIFQVSDPEGVLLWNVPPGMYTTEETPTSLIIRMKKAAVDACKGITGTGVALSQIASNITPVFLFISFYILYKYILYSSIM